MFHLFNKVYLSFDFTLEFGNRIVLSDQFADMLFEDQPEGEEQLIAKDYDSLITDRFGGDENALWSFLSNIPYDNNFVIYASVEEFVPFVIKYLRAVFPNATDNRLYVLYRLTMLKFQMLHSQINHSGRLMGDLYKGLDILSKKKFIQMAKGISSITPFSEEIKKNVGIEFLMPSYLLDTDTVFDQTFEDRTRKIVWKSIAWEINEFKRNGLNGFFNFDELFDEVSSLNFETATFDTALKDKPELAFMQDQDVNPSNLDYIKEKYDIAEIFKFYYDQQRYIHGDSDTMDAFLRAHESYAGTAQSVMESGNVKPMDDNIRALVDLDIETNFGTQIFARSEYRTKMNPFIISFFYDLVRKGKMKELKKFVM